MSQLDEGLVDHQHRGRLLATTGTTGTAATPGTARTTGTPGTSGTAGFSISPPSSSSISSRMDSSFQDSPTIGRSQNLPLSGSHAHSHGGYYSPSNSPLPTPSSSTTASSRRKPAPSPLLQTSAAVSTPISPGPTPSDFPLPAKDSYTAFSIPRIVTTAAVEDQSEQSSLAEQTYFHSDSSGANTPEQRSPGPAPSPLSRQFPNEIRSVSDPVVTTKPPPARGAPLSQSSTMAGPSAVRAAPATGAPRNSSMDSAISAISSRSAANRGSSGDVAGTTDIAHLIKTAGSAEAVIQYLLKEKSSQSQQNAQLWRLVDKQRAMILGLNKDLERALKDKEKYRKRAKELEPDVPPVPPVPAPAGRRAGETASSVANSLPREQVLQIPASPGLDSDSQKHSPIDVSLAPYPITPPADHPSAGALPSAVGEMLDPSHAMPKPSEHALGQFDLDAQEREAEATARRAAESKELHINLALPPSRSVPREPPKMPPPQLPAGVPDRSPKPDEGVAQFPAPPPRKSPPAPLQIKKAPPAVAPAAVIAEDDDSDTDYDDILEVDEITQDRRGRRRTREEDDREREILVRKEAEMRSLSKKSKKSNSQKGTPRDEAPALDEMPASPRLVMPPANVVAQQRETASLAGVLSGASDIRASEIRVPRPLLSPGLPASPRPGHFRSPVSSPPLSPLGVSTFSSSTMSPRLSRAPPVPLPPNTPQQTPPAGDGMPLSSPRPLNIVKQAGYGPSAPSPTKSTNESPIERTKVFRGFVTDEYPDLLLPPNALPSIDIKVASSRMKPSRASLLSLTQLEEDPVFTLAIYSRADAGELWRVEKDSASLAKLDQRLKQCSAFTARTPDRSLFSGHAPAKLDARRVALNQYLDELLNTPLDNATALELCKYLSTNTLPPNADETGGSPSDSVSEMTLRSGPGGRPFRSGYLTKRGKNFGGWKARFFVLEGPQLRYYETPGGAHLGTIKLQKAQIGKQSHHNNEDSPARGPGPEDSDNQYRHAFLILEPKKKDPNSVTKHVLCAESDKERDQWVDALLRWIDYKDPEDEDHTPDRPGPGPTERPGTANKKKGQGQKQHQQQHSTSSDSNLIGVSYENTKQGEIPQGVSEKGRRQHADNDHPQPPPQYTISAPRDPQVLSTSESWGNKLGMGLAPPTQEEKKARKRSFFGFGPKPRTSSDGQDSLFGNDSNSGSSGVTLNPFGGAIRPVFGATLGEAVLYNAPFDVRVPLPAVVYRCIQYLDFKEAVREEGIFRLSGSNVVIKQLKERFNTEGDINLITDDQYYDIHAVASLLKAYLRELPTTILTNDMRKEFLNVVEMTDQREKIRVLSELVQRLPQANATLLKYLISFLIKIIDSASVNKMTVRNVGIVFSPTLNIPAPIFALFLQNFEPVFGVSPSEYRLPILDPDGQRERRPSLPMDRPSFQQERRPSDGRPSTSHSDTNHRQRMMEAVLEGHAARSTPTPPPMSMQQMAQMNAATMHSRSTPTPPPLRPITYEYPVNGGGAARPPAYDSGLAPPPGFDPSQVMTPTYGKPSVGYDRPMYEGGLTPAPYEQPYKSRRESSMFMGNLTQQPSKSRLRDESQF